jgi:hypothetical protein
MKPLIVGIWAIAVTLGAGWGAASLALSRTQTEEKPMLEGLQYTSLPTMSIPVIDRGKVEGYVVVRMVYTADSAVLKHLAAEPDAFITDEIFRTVYQKAETDFGKLRRLDLATLAEEVKARVNERMGDAVVQDLLVDGLNYIDLNAPDGGKAAAAAVGAAEAAPAKPAKAH